MTIYLDQAATSFPKPPQVPDAIRDYLERAGNPGRSGHKLARAAEDLLWSAREDVASLLSVPDPARVVFTMNATMALNMTLQGLLRPGDRVLTSSFEHNSVVRPLHALEAAGVSWRPVPPSSESPLDLNRLEEALRGDRIRAVVVAHASNVTGAVVPLADIRRLTADHGALLVVDAAQTAGHIPLSVRSADVIACSGHKGLLGPQGTGVLVVGEGVEIKPTIRGGTGGRSEALDQPRWLPYALESGTPNGTGIAGLAAGVRYLMARDLSSVAKQEQLLRERFVAAASAIPKVSVLAQPSPVDPVPVVSLTMDGRMPSTVAELLEERAQVLVRGGLHCAPLAHRTLGTSPAGTVRFGMSHMTTSEEVDTALAALAEIAQGDGLS
jgi:cysteine desulfurase family protein